MTRAAAASTKPDEKEVWILKHVANEGAGTIHDYLNGQKIPVRFIELYRGETIPADLSNVRAVCVMGGPMNVDDESKHPFLSAEKKFIRTLVEKNIPVLGVCLGSQLIAAALGKKVYKASAPEIGWCDVTLTPEAATDPVLSALPQRPISVLQWHEDTFDLPDGAVLLARGSEVPHQAFRVGRSVYGFQFHVEVTGSMLMDWFEKRAESAAIMNRYRAYQAELGVLTRRVYERFFSLVS
jgi:GMP synthase (glutamine-hydrolysing)